MQLCQKIKKECWWIYCDQIIKIENIGIGRKDSVKFIHFEIPGTFPFVWTRVILVPGNVFAQFEHFYFFVCGFLWAFVSIHPQRECHQVGILWLLSGWMQDCCVIRIWLLLSECLYRWEVWLHFTTDVQTLFGWANSLSPQGPLSSHHGTFHVNWSS